jgi:phosphotriesterase-related protein
MVEVQQVETVTGPVPVSELGVVLPHEHVFLDGEWPFERHTFDLMLDNEELAIEEVKHYRAAGGTTLIDLSHASTGRDPLALRRVSEATGIQIVMGCGWYRQPYYGSEVDESSVDELAQVVVDEIRDGVGDTGIRPGIVGEIGSHKGYVTAQEERAFRAAARAAQETGLALTTHSVPDLKWTQRKGRPVGLTHLDIVESEGMDLSRVIVGHCDSWMHLDYHLAVAERGAYVQFDNVGSHTWLGVADAPWVEQTMIDHVKQLVAAGFARQVLLSQDVCRKSGLKAYGGNGYDYLLTKFVPLLAGAGVDAATIDLIIRENPTRLLTPGG